MFLYFQGEKESIFFLSSFQLQDSHVTELNPNKQHRITGDEDERMKCKQESTSVCMYYYIKLRIGTAWPN